MPSKSARQARFFAAAAHDPDFAEKAGVSQTLAQEWHNADKRVIHRKKVLRELADRYDRLKRT